MLLAYALDRDANGVGTAIHSYDIKSGHASLSLSSKVNICLDNEHASAIRTECLWNRIGDERRRLHSGVSGHARLERRRMDRNTSSQAHETLERNKGSLQVADARRGTDPRASELWDIRIVHLQVDLGRQ